MGKKFDCRRLAEYKNIDDNEWLEIRRKGIGGSDIAAVAGMNPWRGQYDVWLEKTGQYKKEFSLEQQARMDIGSEIEGFIANLFAKFNPTFSVEKRNCIFQHAFNDTALTNIDRAIWDDSSQSWGVLEIKNVGEYSFNTTDWSETTFPFYYACQVQWELYVTDLDWAFLAVLVGGNKYRQYKILRDNQIINDLVITAAKFWQRVTAGVIPEMDHTESCGKSLEKMYPREDKKIDLSLQAGDVYALRNAKRQLDKAEEMYEKEKNNFKKLMEGHNEAMFDGKKIATWKTMKGYESIDTKKLKAEQPEIASQYTVKKPDTTVFKFFDF